MFIHRDIEQRDPIKPTKHTIGIYCMCLQKGRLSILGSVLLDVRDSRILRGILCPTLAAFTTRNDFKLAGN